jgi:hypothetical protein
LPGRVAVGGRWSGYFSWWPVATIVGFTTVMMFRRRDPKRLDKRVHELPRGVVVLLGDRREIGVAGCRRLKEEADRAGLVRYADSFANLRVFLLTAKPPLLTRVCCRNTVGTLA